MEDAPPPASDADGVLTLDFVDHSRVSIAPKDAAGLIGRHVMLPNSLRAICVPHARASRCDRSRGTRKTCCASALPSAPSMCAPPPMVAECKNVTVGTVSVIADAMTKAQVTRPFRLWLALFALRVVCLEYARPFSLATRIETDRYSTSRPGAIVCLHERVFGTRVFSETPLFVFTRAAGKGAQHARAREPRSEIGVPRAGL